MQKIKEINGKIKIVNVPNGYNGVENIEFGYKNRTDLHLKDGFFEIITPTITEVQQLDYNLENGVIDLEAGTFTYGIIDLVIDLDVEKAKKIQQLKQNANAKFEKNQWYYDREIKLEKMKRTVKKVPQEILDEDALIYDAVDLKEAEILTLTTYSEIINYNVML